jgi:hypothetical protein
MGRRAKITDRVAKEIRRKYATGESASGTRYSMAMLGKEYGISVVTTENIINYRGAYAPGSVKGRAVKPPTEYCTWDVEDGRIATTSCGCVVTLRYDERPTMCVWCSEPIQYEDE